jgi:hypothetical protein
MINKKLMILQDLLNCHQLEEQLSRKVSMISNSKVKKKKKIHLKMQFDFIYAYFFNSSSNIS